MGKNKSWCVAADEIDRLRAELAEAKLERDTALTDRHDTIQDLRAELAAAHGQIIGWQKFDNQLREKVIALKADNAAKDARIAQLEAELQTAKHALEFDNKEFDVKNARIAELETDHLFAENKRLREGCQEFRARAEKAEADAAAADRCMRDYNRRLMSAEAERDALRKNAPEWFAALRKVEAERDAIANATKFLCDAIGRMEDAGCSEEVYRRAKEARAALNSSEK